MKKKVISALLVTTMVAGMLVGCGSKDAAETPATDDAATEEPAAEEPAAEEPAAEEPAADEGHSSGAAPLAHAHCHPHHRGYRQRGYAGGGHHRQ